VLGKAIAILTLPAATLNKNTERGELRNILQLHGTSQTLKSLGILDRGGEKRRGDAE